MGELGVNAYRFSIAWPRLFPTGAGGSSGAASTTTTGSSTRCSSAASSRSSTLYHWDLPQALEDEGGWLHRDTVERFAEYARTCYDAYGDRVSWWLTINEPWIVGLLGYLHGLHAPASRTTYAARRPCSTTCCSRTGAECRSCAPRAARARSGSRSRSRRITRAATTRADVEASEASDGYVNRWFLDPVLKGSYPDDMRAALRGDARAARLHPGRRSRDDRDALATTSASTTTRGA